MQKHWYLITNYLCGGSLLRVPDPNAARDTKYEWMLLPYWYDKKGNLVVNEHRSIDAVHDAIDTVNIVFILPLTINIAIVA